ncbi:MAG: OmpA family protein [Alphaproteobacteria bacterium]
MTTNILKTSFLILLTIIGVIPTEVLANTGTTPQPIRKPIIFAPTPKVKPFLNNTIEPSAGQEEPETTLVSFALQPDQISLDKNLQYFLEKHALDILNQDENINIHINAYATPISGEEYSDVRISLARALEVRSFLIERNINANRLKLTPFGYASKSSTKNRIDLIFTATDKTPQN